MRLLEQARPVFGLYWQQKQEESFRDILSSLMYYIRPLLQKAVIFCHLHMILLSTQSANL
jgi:hypothetical protein